MIKKFDPSKISDLEPSLVYNFTIAFARLEYAAKAQGLVLQLNDRHTPNLEVDWPAVTIKVKDAFDRRMSQDTKLERAVQYFDRYPPGKQVLKPSGPGYDIPAVQKVSSVERLLLALRRVRNNLFHGGKGFEREDEGRDAQLLQYGLDLILGLVECDDLLRSEFYNQY